MAEANASSSPLPSPNAEQRKNVVKRFAALLGQEQAPENSGFNGSGARKGVVNSVGVFELGALLCKDDSSPVGGGTCSLPSLELFSGDVPDVLANIDSLCATSGFVKGSKGPTLPSSPDVSAKRVSIPPMAASVFTKGDNESNNSPNSSVTDNAAAKANANAAILEQAAAINLGSKVTWTRSSVKLAPSTLLESLFSSFKSLVDSRVKAWTLLLLQNSIAAGDEGSRSHLLRLLSTSSNIGWTAIETKFRALDLPPEVAISLQETQGKDGKPNGPVEIVLPLLFEATMDLTVQSKQFTSKLRAPGTIKAQFSPGNPLLSCLNVDLNTASLVDSMVGQARLIVFKMIAKTEKKFRHSMDNLRRTSTLNTPHLKNTNDAPQLSGLNKMSLDDETPAMNKLENKATNRTVKRKPKKIRSVTWNDNLQTETLPQSKVNEKMEQILNNNSLRSSKNFGRSDAPAFVSQRNATFAEFGRSHANSRVNIFSMGGGLNKNYAATTYNLRAPTDAVFPGDNHNASFSSATSSPHPNKLGMTSNRAGFRKSSARNFALNSGLTFRNN